MNEILILIILLSFTSCITIPSSYDWRDYNVVSPVKQPEAYGSDWALTLTSHLESLYAIQYGKIISLSDIMLLDCCITENTFTIKLMEITFQWLKKNGIMYAADYPYKGVRSTCKYNEKLSVNMKITGYKRMGGTFIDSSICADEEEMKEFLIENGPFIVAFNSVPLQTYRRGIIDLPEEKCPKSGINHSGLLVGYGTENGIDYWIVKNSLGRSWGESGYFRIRRGKGTCGINCHVISAKVSF